MERPCSFCRGASRAARGCALTIPKEGRMPEPGDERAEHAGGAWSY